MATTFQWVAPETIASALTTELNTLTNGSYSAASTAIANESGLYENIALELFLASLTPTGSPSCSVYLLATLDATNYEDGGGATAPALGALLCVFDLSTSASTKRRTKTGLVIPPLGFKLVLQNNSGVSFAGSGSTLRYRRYNEQSV